MSGNEIDDDLERGRAALFIAVGTATALWQSVASAVRKSNGRLSEPSAIVRIAAAAFNAAFDAAHKEAHADPTKPHEGATAGMPATSGVLHCHVHGIVPWRSTVMCRK